MSALLDASFLVAAADASDVNHEAATGWLRRIHEPLLIAGTTLGDADALLQRGLGAVATMRLLEAIAGGSLGLVHPSAADLRRAGELMTLAAEFQPRLADAIVVALADRLGARRIATFERRPFAVLAAPARVVLELEP